MSATIIYCLYLSSWILQVKFFYKSLLILLPNTYQKYDKMLGLALLMLTWLGFAAAGPLSYEPRITQRLTPAKETPYTFELAPSRPTLEALQSLQVAGVFPRTFIDPTCTAEQKSKITTAWNDAKLLAEAQINIISGFDYDTPYRNWLGKDWNAKGDPNKESHSKSIADKLAQLAKLFRGEVPDREYFIWWCTDWSHDCEPFNRLSTSPGRGAFSWIKRGPRNGDDTQPVINEQSTVFCQQFFEAPTLGEQIAVYKDDTDAQLIIDNFHENTGVWMLKEIYHYYAVRRTSQSTIDYLLTAKDCFGRETKDAYINAESYTFCSLAIYLQQTFQTPTSPRPEPVSHEAELDLVLRPGHNSDAG
jgi:hypothetical protein